MHNLLNIKKYLEVVTLEIDFIDELAETGWIHTPLRVDVSKSVESRLLKKDIKESLLLWDGKDMNCWESLGRGSMLLNEDGILRITVPARSDAWPEGCPEDGDYCSFGQLEAILDTSGADWTRYNRLYFKIRPECNGMHSPMISIRLRNDGTIKIPDIYDREGYHIIHLKNHIWNTCIWEFPALPRDRVTSLTFEVHSYGLEVSMDCITKYDISDICLQSIKEPDNTVGWQCMDNTAVFSTEGYWADGRKTAIANTSEDTFHLRDVTSNKIVFTGKAEHFSSNKGAFSLLDFSDVKTPGTYRIEYGNYIGDKFKISDKPLEESIWKVLNFLYCERCGYPVGGGHGTCHGDIIARHNSLQLAYAGGWHDAGDVSQQTVQTAEVAHALLEMAVKIKNDRPLYNRLMEEAAWGLDFVLRMHFGDGYLATSAGIRRWSNGLIGDMDDTPARVHNHSFENFLISGIEAYAATAFSEKDSELAWKCLDSARNDYRFALQRFQEKGMELPIFFEHTYNSGLSQYWATASWAASMIYKASKDMFFAKEAEAFTNKFIECQETGNSEIPLKGFFYRSPEKKTIVHFNHQSREQIFMQALDALCRTQPENPRIGIWENSMRIYGMYIKSIMQYSKPYGLIPAGIHCIDECEDSETFPLLHLMTAFENEKDNYRQQLVNGIKISDRYYIRCFPVWFSFRGNTAVHLSAGKAASIAGKYFNDKELVEIAREQIYWTFGKNPFGQSLVYGAGSNYSQQYGALNGEMVGSIPVGIETRGNDDVPFWPMENNATYKEVWTTSAGRWLWVAADIY